MVHCLHDLDDLEQPTNCEVRVGLDHPHTPYELFEIGTFRGSQLISLKERNDRLKEIAPLTHDVLVKVLFVVVISVIAV